MKASPLFSCLCQELLDLIQEMFTEAWLQKGEMTGENYRTILLLLLLSHFSRVRLCETPSLGLSRQEHGSGLPFPSPMHKSEKWKWSPSVMSNSSRPQGLQPTRLLCPWDFPGKSPGVGCHCLLHRTILPDVKTSGVHEGLCFLGY